MRPRFLYPALLLFALALPFSAIAATVEKKIIRGEISYGGTASGYTVVMPEKGNDVTLPNMSDGAQTILEHCGEQGAVCEVVYSIDKKGAITVHSAKRIQ